MARPRKPISEDQVIQLAAINCSYAEMAAVLDIDASNLTRRFAQVIEKGRATGRMSLKRKQWEMAMGGNITMLIWLGKQNLGQTDKWENRIDAKVETLSSSERARIDDAKKMLQTMPNERDKK